MPSSACQEDGQLGEESEAVVTHSAAVAAAEAQGTPQRIRKRIVEMMIHDWMQLHKHANEAALKETWELPPEELIQRCSVAKILSLLAKCITTTVQPGPRPILSGARTPHIQLHSAR